MSAANGNQVWQRKAGVTTIAHSAAPVPADGRYHFVAATMDGAGSARIYVDGLDSTVSVSPVQAIADTAFPLTFAAAASARADFDEFALYDQVLGAGQIKNHHDTGIG